jgi:hypothetical protein
MENKYQQELKTLLLLVQQLRMLNHLWHHVQFHLHDDSVNKDFLEKRNSFFPVYKRKKKKRYELTR